MTNLSKFVRPRLAASTLLAAGLVCLATPTFAAEKDSNTATQASASLAATAERPAAAEKKYCFAGVSTGSILQRKECRTKADWASQGVDVEKYVK